VTEDTLADLLKRIEEIRIARLRPGDVIVVKTPAHVEQDDLIDMYAEVMRWFPGHDVRFTVGVDIEVVRPEDAPAERCTNHQMRTYDLPWGHTMEQCVICRFVADDPPADEDASL
jgi:hypothetical protein